ncbi:Uncharacterized protein DBV15_08082 [Temnothorax longispinosus]|uniref:Uncharacterized protein n=1 Tax=Temnothorax longispinosus TaxID=300112 RepID=A0A4S2JRD5_9HYME|nr:Uncharacterized protein DBV15_08082 [Temnothorax longispinosus]
MRPLTTPLTGPFGFNGRKSPEPKRILVNKGRTEKECEYVQQPPKGNLADAVKTVVLYAYTGVHARPDPTYVYVDTCGIGQGRIGYRGSKKHSRAFPAPDNTVNVNSMSYGDARKMEEHAGRHCLQERSSVERPSCHAIFVHLIPTIPLSWSSGTRVTSFRFTGKLLTPAFYGS